MFAGIPSRKKKGGSDNTARADKVIEQTILRRTALRVRNLPEAVTGLTYFHHLRLQYFSYNLLVW